MFNKHCHCEPEIPPHVHDIKGYTCPGGQRCQIHEHCFNAVTCGPIPCGDSHVHEIELVTDIVECHCHKICGRTGPAIPFGFNSHIHLVEGGTTFNDCHNHCVNVSTGTDKPIC